MVLDSFKNYHRITIKHNIYHKIYQLTVTFIDWLIVFATMYSLVFYIYHNICSFFLNFNRLKNGR